MTQSTFSKSLRGPKGHGNIKMFVWASSTAGRTADYRYIVEERQIAAGQSPISAKMLMGKQLSGWLYRRGNHGRKPRINNLALPRHLAGQHNDLYAAMVSQLAEKIRRGQLVHGEIVELNMRQRIDVRREKLARRQRTIHGIHDNNL